MNRIQVTYGGQEYVIGNRPLADVEAEVAAGVDSGKAAWLDVVYGEGTPTRCRLLLTTGVPIALVDFPHTPEA